MSDDVRTVCRHCHDEPPCACGATTLRPLSDEMVENGWAAWNEQNDPAVVIEACYQVALRWVERERIRGDQWKDSALDRDAGGGNGCGRRAVPERGPGAVTDSGDPVPVPYGDGRPGAPCDECHWIPGRHCCQWNFEDEQMQREVAL